MNFNKFQFKLSTILILLTVVGFGIICVRNDMISAQKLQDLSRNKELLGKNEQTMNLAYVYQNAPDRYPDFIRGQVCTAIFKEWEIEKSLKSHEKTEHMMVVHELLKLINCQHAEDFFRIYDQLSFDAAPFLPDNKPYRSKKFERFILGAVKEDYSGYWDY